MSSLREVMGSGQLCILPEGKVQAEDAQGVPEGDMQVGSCYKS